MNQSPFSQKMIFTIVFLTFAIKSSKVSESGCMKMYGSDLNNEVPMGGYDLVKVLDCLKYGRTPGFLSRKRVWKRLRKSGDWKSNMLNGL